MLFCHKMGAFCLPSPESVAESICHLPKHGILNEPLGDDLVSPTVGFTSEMPGAQLWDHASTSSLTTTLLCNQLLSVLDTVLGLDVPEASPQPARPWTADRMCPVTPVTLMSEDRLHYTSHQRINAAERTTRIMSR